MVTFEWKVTKSSSRDLYYIYWSAEWDGRWDNDELVSDEEYWGENYCQLPHPFHKTIDYMQSKDTYEHYKNIHNKNTKKQLPNWLTIDNAEIDPEEHNPENLRDCGDHVAVNIVTVSICELLSDNKQLAAASGNIHPVSYRATLLGCISELWD